jgi:hypothetical protein
MIPGHANLEVHKVAGSPKERKTTAIYGVSPPVVFSSHNNGIIALERAVLERVFNVKRCGKFAPPFKPSSDEHFFQSLSEYSRIIRKHLPSTVPITKRQFVDTYRGRKRVVYEAALESLERKPVTLEDSFVKVFVKFEKFNQTAKPDAVPRVVSPRHPRFNVEFGRYIRPIEERIFDAIGEVYGSKTVMKGMNASDSGKLMREKWNMFCEPVAVGLDAERFDQHVSTSALKYEHWTYLSCFWRPKDKRRLQQFCNQQLINKCSGNAPDGWLKYHTDGVRMSGDMNTSLGNCVLMCAMIYSYARSCDTTIQLANNGDDCVVFMERAQLGQFMGGLYDWFKNMGFSMVCEKPVHDFEQISFCQTQPVWVGPGIDDYLMVRDPRVAISKDSVALQPLTRPKEVSGWLDAVGRGGLALTGAIPVWQNFYSMYIRSAIGPKSKIETGWGWGVRSLSRSIERTYAPPTEYTRYSFWLAFGISPDEQLCIERHYDAMDVGLVVNPHVYRHVTLPF